MRLAPVTPARPDTRLRCIVCGQWFPSDQLCADLDGEPFRAYYCAADRPAAPADQGGSDHV